jgi:prepilin-type N-terminal cleavage/methylation domain-containing protein
MPMRHKSNDYGVTLIELLIAITVSAFVVSGALLLYVNVSKGFWKHKENAEKVREMIVAKIKIDAAIANLGKIETYTTTGFSAWSAHADSLIEFTFTSDTLFASKKPVAFGMKTFMVEMIQNNTTEQTGVALLQWEAEMTKGGWIGGSRAVYK